MTGDTELAKINPCSYRGYDYDEETGYYYLQSRYYDPEMGRFISVDAPETLVLSNNILATNLYAYCYNNSVNYEDPSGFIAANVIGAVIGLVIGIVGGVFLGNWLADKLNLTGWTRNVFVAGIAALTGAASAAIGNFIGPYVAKITSTFGKYVVKLVKTGKIKVKKLSSGLKNSVSQLFKETCCFVEGTQISSLYGYIPIEDIKIGDYVRSTNIETGEIGFKRVTEVFVRETNLLCRIKTSGKEILSTCEHPFWVVGYGWKEALSLKKGDVLQTQNDNTVTVLECQVEYVDQPIMVYNFEVEDWHTYYVGSDQILVHNKCNLVKATDKYLKDNGLNAHAIKSEYLGKTNISHYDLYYSKEEKVIFILRKGAKESQAIATYYTLK